MIISGNKFFGTDDSRIRKVACPISKAVNSADFILFFSLFFHHHFFNDLTLTDFGAIHRTGFVNIPSITSQPFFGKLKFMS